MENINTNKKDYIIVIAIEITTVFSTFAIVS